MRTPQDRVRARADRDGAWLRRLARQPLFVLLMLAGAALMVVPISYAAAVRDWDGARTFLHSAVLISLMAVLIGLAVTGSDRRAPARNQLVTLVAAFTVLPAILAIPFQQVQNGAFLHAYVEMVSSLTTTGASLWQPHELSNTLHLWRATVGWFGGLIVWVTAFAILAPMNLGGFEIISSGQGPSETASLARSEDGRQSVPGILLPGRVESGNERVLRLTGRLLPVYGGLTAALWALLSIAGETPLIGLSHAMSTLSTSGISPVGGVQWGAGGRVGEMLLFLFFVFGITRYSFLLDDTRDRWRHMYRDPEARMGVLCVLILPGFLFLRHFLAAGGADSETDLVNALRAFWGGAFTVLSFLTTTGFESTDWIAARNWSGLQTPGLILMGLALVGGGVATTAGGVKLLRVYALYMHGRREMERLVHPSSVGGSGWQARRIRREGALVAWIFFMLFALSLSVIGLALAATGLNFETATVLAVAALSTCGPLAAAAPEVPIHIGALPDSAKVVLAFAMSLGRLETLALLALLNPGFWRG